MVKDDIVRRGRELLAVLVHLRHLLGLDGAVDGRAGKAQHGHAHAEELHLTEHEEGHDQHHQGIRKRHAAGRPKSDGCKHHSSTCDL